MGCSVLVGRVRGETSSCDHILAVPTGEDGRSCAGSQWWLAPMGGWFPRQHPGDQEVWAAQPCTSSRLWCPRNFNRAGRKNPLLTWSHPLRVLPPLTGPKPSECEGAGPNSPPSPQRHPERVWLSQRPQGRKETKSSQKPKANFLLALGPRGVIYSFLEIKLYILLPIDSPGIHLNDLNFIAPPET